MVKYWQLLRIPAGTGDTGVYADMAFARPLPKNHYLVQ
jgi:hypothetical protein